MKLRFLKKMLYSIPSALLILLSSCATTMPIAQESGMGNFAYLLVASSGQNVNKKVVVTLDNKTSFVAKAVKRKQDHENGTVYQVTPGKLSIKIERKGNILYEGNIFVSQHETKIIQIP